MYEYKLEIVKLSTLTGKPKQDIEEIIEQMAQLGWRLHTYTPIQSGGYGMSSEIHLVFEKQK
jgi:MoaA/NifB/PqqE/SkfB family radical SAM enzyme